MPLHLAPIIEGNESGDTIVFIQGWPDDASLWDASVAALRSEYRCVRMTMPNFDGARTARRGYQTAEIVEGLVEMVREVARGDRVTLVLHDWGCYWGHALHHRHPELVSRVAGVDVSPHYRPPSPKAALGIVAYQWWLYAAFGLGGPIGDGMTRAFARVAHAPVNLPRLTAWMNYPYRNIWADLFSGRAAESTRGYWPDCPLLFVYGEKKPFPFHSEKWVSHVRSVGGEVAGIPCGHWVPREPAFVDVLARWLKRTRSS